MLKRQWEEEETNQHNIFAFCFSRYSILPFPFVDYYEASHTFFGFVFRLSFLLSLYARSKRRKILHLLLFVSIQYSRVTFSFNYVFLCWSTANPIIHTFFVYVMVTMMTVMVSCSCSIYDNLFSLFSTF